MEHHEIFDSDFFMHLHRLKLLGRFKPHMGLWGSRKSGAKGSSLEYSDFRDYIPGDDWRRIDWNSYGRTDRLLVRLFVEEKECVFKIFMDCSSSMDFGSIHKGHYAARLCAALGFIILNQQDRVKVISENVPGNGSVLAGTQSFSKILGQLRHIAYTKDYNLWNVIRSEGFLSKGITILISDFFIEEDLEQIIKYLVYRKQKVILLHVLCEEELHPDMEGTLNLIDSETDKHTRVTISSGFLNDYHKTLERFIERNRELAKKYDAVYSLVPTSQPLEKTFWEGLA